MSANLSFSETQETRLLELGVPCSDLAQGFATKAERNRAFQEQERALARKNREQLRLLLEESHEPALCALIRTLAATLHAMGFTQVATPTTIPRLFLERMGITTRHPLHRQVYWLDAKTCLRPMLAPGLYALSQRLLNVADLPLRLFEIGSCFRRESEGHRHLREFTMLNLVEWGTPVDERIPRLEELMRLVLDAGNLKGYRLEEEDSTIYGRGMDAVDRHGLELASSSMGPHRLDPAWRIATSWVGIGFGLERLLMSREGGEDGEGGEGIHRHARSFTFLDGVSLNMK
ncbi:MAG: hypothetical protein LBS98_06900 [Coriobacteriales bacterium]|jgi:phenylalanyl-tRNA synthetase alpha chain|nr:hypothetical protein [Coriobacteriales bacterium]